MPVVVGVFVGHNYLRRVYLSGVSTGVTGRHGGSLSIGEVGACRKMSKNRNVGDDPVVSELVSSKGLPGHSRGRSHHNY